VTPKRLETFPRRCENFLGDAGVFHDMPARVSSDRLDCNSELARLAAGTVHTGELFEASRRIMQAATRPGTEGTHWSQAAAFHGRALFVQGRITDGLGLIEEAWRRADELDDPIAGSLAAQIGGVCCSTLYDHPQAEAWCMRELQRPRSRLVASLHYSLTDLLAGARVSQGNLAGARDVLAEFEGAESRHFMLAYCEGDWERAAMLLRTELDAARAAGQLFAVGSWAPILGRFARFANRRVEAEAYLDEALRASLACPDLSRELFTRTELALVNADLGRIAPAQQQLKRCQQILDNGEDWRGHKGAFAYASALVGAVEHLRKVNSSDELWRVSLEQGGALRLPEEVADGFRAAIEIFRRYRAPWEEAGALLFWSRVLFAASRQRESAGKFNAAFAIFERVGTPQWSERAQAEIFRFLALDSGSASVSMGNGRGSNIFRKDGDYWTISFEGSVLHLRDTMGMHYIGRLVANPGTDFSVQDLAAGAYKANLKRRSRKKPPSPLGNGRTNGDRDDQYDAARERARLMVTKRIKDAIAKIRLTHPELARHLATCIRTGYTCAYVGDDAHPNSWLN
jgi:tetratricopeptide (TPR) repeat protein